MYFNPIYQYGIKNFIENVAVGVAGLVIPDLPIEEREEIRKIVDSGNYPLDLIPLVAPTSRERIKRVVDEASGFVYAVSSKGVTGVRKKFSEDLEGFIGQIKAVTDIPVALGFGIGDVETVSKIKDYVDGVIIGSVLVEMIEKASTQNEAVGRIGNFIKTLREVLD